MSAAKRLCLIGCGRMGSIFKAAIAGHSPEISVDIFSPHLTPAITALLRPADRFFNQPAPVPDVSYDVVVIALKPQIMAEALPAYAPLVGRETIVLSLAAGRTVGFVRDALSMPITAPVVRAMPNTPCAIGEGVLGCFADPEPDTEKRIRIEKWLCPMGLVSWLENEDLLDLFTAVCGSGPGFIFAYLEELLAAGIDRRQAFAALSPAGEFFAAYSAAARAEGFAGSDADRVIGQLIAGTAHLAEKEAQRTFAELRADVTSPNGTTAAGLAAWEAGRHLTLEPRLRMTFRAARERATALAV